LGSSTGSTTFTSANAGASNFTLTFPAATDQLVARATTDTLTNKTYDTAGTGNTFKINGTSITAISGNTGTVGTTTGTLTSTHCVNIDASGNLKDSGATCGGGSSTITAGTTATSGYTAGQFVYSDGSLAQASTGLTYVGTGQVLAALGTITTTKNALSITATWNAAIVFGAPLLMNVTNTSSSSGSKFVDVQIGGGTIFSVGYTSNTDPILSFFRAGAGSADTLIVGGSTFTFSTASAGTAVYINGSGSNSFDGVFLNNALNSGGSFGWTTGFSGTDTNLSRAAAGVVAVGTGGAGNVAGTLKAANYVSANSVPVDGGGSCLASTFAGGASAGTFAAAVCAGGTIAITFAFSAPTGWSCDAEDRTTPSTGKLQQTASTATKATFLATNSAADVIQYKCIAY
jgi:hypothetical protein